MNSHGTSAEGSEELFVQYLYSKYMAVLSHATFIHTIYYYIPYFLKETFCFVLTMYWHSVIGCEFWSRFGYKKKEKEKREGGRGVGGGIQ